MKTKTPLTPEVRRKRWLITAVVLGLTLWLAWPVIEYLSPKTIHWRQEAVLHDGRVLVVERVSKLGTSVPFSQDKRPEYEQRIRFKNPDTGEEIQWEAQPGFAFRMLDFEGGIPYLLIDPVLYGTYEEWGCPNPPYLVFRYSGKKWGLIDMTQLPESLQWFNLLAGAKGHRAKGGMALDHAYINADEVERAYGQARSLRYPQNHPEHYGVPQHGLDARKFSREKMSPGSLVSLCGSFTLVVMGREAEMDEESRMRWEKDIESTPPDAMIDYLKRVEQRKKELERRMK